MCSHLHVVPRKFELDKLTTAGLQIAPIDNRYLKELLLLVDVLALFLEVEKILMELYKQLVCLLNSNRVFKWGLLVEALREFLQAHPGCMLIDARRKSRAHIAHLHAAAELVGVFADLLLLE